MRNVRAPVTVSAVVCLLLWTLLLPNAAEARSKPGPVDERGIATAVGSAGFTLLTKSHGSIHVIVSPDTAVTASGHRVRMGNGDHVGVRGFASGGVIRAIWVHVYARAAVGPLSVAGTVVSITSSLLTVRTSGGRQTFQILSSTVVVIGAHRGVVTDVRSGDRVLVRIQQGSSGGKVLHIHVYRSAAHLRHVSLSGTVVATGTATITVKTAMGFQRVGIPASTVVYLGSTRASSSTLHAGQRVRVYACCAGRPLSATSVHIYKTHPHVVTEIIRGTVTGIGPGEITLSAAGKVVSVTTSTGTHYQIASAPAGRGDLRLGDVVTVRAHLLRGRLRAIRIDVPAASRAQRMIVGTITAVSARGITVVARGRQYTLNLSARPTVTLGGQRVPTSTLRVGDKVHATGTLRGTTLQAAQVSAIRAPPVVKTVHGTVVTVTGSAVVVIDRAGVRHTLWVPPGVRATAQGRPVPVSVLFPGVRVAARGTEKGGRLVAASLQVSLTSRDITGRLQTETQANLGVRVGARTFDVDMGGSPSIRDGGQHVPARALRIGAFLEIRGYETTSHQLRATAIRVLHPELDITGTFSSDASGFSTRTSQGEVYRFHVSEATQISNERAPVTVTMDDVPDGVHLHVMGTARSDGSISAANVVVRLQSRTFRGKVLSITGSSLTVSSGTGQETVRLDANAAIRQGSQTLQVSDVAVGDDVTVAGYIGRTAILARFVQVHRPLIGLTGVVQSMGTGGLTLNSSTGVVRVTIGPTTELIGTIALGLTVHVTGYRRGDGVILATRIRVGK